MKRELTEQEKKMANANLGTLQDELEYLSKVLIVRKQLSVDTAHLEFKLQVKALKNELKQLKAKEIEMQNIISITKDQVENGVEMKETEEEAKNE